MFILKQYSPTQGKGILIFTHNETIYLLKTIIPLLKDKYYFIQHVQFNVQVIRHPLINLHLMPKYNLQNPRIDIPIATHMLIDSKFNYKNTPNDIIQLKNILTKINKSHDILNFHPNHTRPIDMIYCGRLTEFKFTFEILQYVINICQKITTFNCVFVILPQSTITPYHNKFFNLYNSLPNIIKK